MSNPASNPNKSIDDGPGTNHVADLGIKEVPQKIDNIEAAADHKYATHNEHNKADDNPGGRQENEQTRKTHSSRNNDVGDATSATK